MQTKKVIKRNLIKQIFTIIVWNSCFKIALYKKIEIIYFILEMPRQCEIKFPYYKPHWPANEWLINEMFNRWQIQRKFVDVNVAIIIY